MKKTNKNKIIVLTPIRNEGWFLDVFLAATSLWADIIILADQQSTDNSIEIAKKYEKVIIVKSKPLKYFDEYKMRNVLFEEARKINGSKILFAIDADEIFTPNIFYSSEWKKILSFQPGTVIEFKWANICPSFNEYWSPSTYFAKAFVDDGSPYIAGKIHTLNIPFPINAKIFKSKEIKLMHFQYVDWKRMESKHQWYQCWERINNPSKSSISIYRQYHHMYQIKKREYMKIPNKWLSFYNCRGIDAKDFTVEEHYWRDLEVLNYLKSFGAKYFSNEAIWDTNWVSIARYYKFNNGNSFSDPRNIKQKFVQTYLKKTQKYYPNILIKIVDQLIKLI